MIKLTISFLLLCIHQTIIAQTINPPKYSVDRNVFDLESYGDTLIVAGDFLHAGYYTGGLAMVSTDSDLANMAYPKSDELVIASTHDGNGGVYYVSQTTGYIKHIYSNNTVDTSCHIFIGTNNGGGLAWQVKILYHNGVVYVAGPLSSLLGSSSSNLIAFDAASKLPLANIPHVNNEVTNLRINNNILYLTGEFDSVGGQNRKKIAAIDLSNHVVTPWYPTIPLSIDQNQLWFGDMAFSGTQIFISGYYSNTITGGLNIGKILVCDLNTGAFNRFIFSNTGLFAGVFSSMYWAANIEKVLIDGNILYAKSWGTFDTRITAIDLSNGDSAIWARFFDMTNTFSDMAISGNSLYAVGNLTNIYFPDFGNQTVGAFDRRLFDVVKLNKLTGQVENWDPHPSALIGGGTTCITLNGNNVFLGGKFTHINSSERPAIYMMNSTTEQILPFTFNASLFDKVYDVKVKDSIMYVAGNWQITGESYRKSIRAYNLNTGQELNWYPGYFGDAYTIEVSDNYVFAGGDFTETSNGITKQNLIAIDRVSGQVLNWTPNPNYMVKALHIADGNLFVGGNFNIISGQSKSYLAVINLATLNVTSWTPASLNGFVNTINSKGSLIWIGGEFTNVNGTQVDKFAGLSKMDGSLQKYTLSNSNIGWAKDLVLNNQKVILGNTGSGNFPIDTCGSPFVYSITNNNLQKQYPLCLNLDNGNASLNAITIIGNDLYYGGNFKETNGELKGVSLGRLTFNTGYFQSPPLTQEINVEGNYNQIAAGDTTTTLNNNTDFGGAITGSTIQRSFSVLNSGNSDLVINNIFSSGPNASQFTVSPLIPGNTISPNSSGIFTITFTPTGGDSLKKATITILNNDIDEGVYDFSIQAYDGKASTLTFDGINDYIDIANSTDSVFTIEAWIKTTANSFTGSFAYEGNGIMWSDVGGYANDFTIAILNNKLSFFDGSGSIPTNGNTILNNGSWHHIAIVRNGATNSTTLYVDGMIDGVNTANNVALNANPHIHIGGNTLDNRYFNGFIDEVRIWNSARTQSEIQSNINCEISSSRPGLVANYHFNQGIPNANNTTDTQLLDASANNNSGTLHNFSLSGSNSNWTIPGVFTNGITCDHILNIKLFLEGYYASTGYMTSVLMNQGVSTNSTICDSITVELRNVIFPYNIIEKVTTLLNTDGTATCTFTTSGTYYIVINHRNSLQTWSALPVELFNNTSYDFSSMGSKAYGNNMLQIDSNIWAIYSGDVNQDENIDLLDLSLLENDISSFQFGYSTSDINGDGNVDLLDSPTPEENSNNFIFSNHP